MTRVFYHDAKGEFTGQLSGVSSPAELANLRSRGIAFVVVPDSLSFADNYLVDGVPVPKPIAPIVLDRNEIQADGESTATISGLPTPCQVLIDDQPVQVEDGEIVFTSTMPETYFVVFDQFPFRPWSAFITAI